MYRQRFPDDPGMHNSEERRYSHIERAPTFCDRVGSSLITTAIGAVMIVGAVVLLGWNEGRAVRTAQSLDEGLSLVAELRSAQVVEPQLNGKLVHLSGQISCDDILSDSTYGVAIGAVSLKRIVEMYQWVEKEHRNEEELANGDKKVTTTYSYEMKWKSELIRSSQFDSALIHKNPELMPIQSQTLASSRVMLGAFTLSKNLVSGINEYKELIPTVTPDKGPRLQIAGKYFYDAENPSYPKVGDLRISFTYAGLCKDSRLGPSQMVSVMAMQEEFTLTGYQTQAGNILEMISLSQQTAEEMIQAAHKENTLMTWLLRGAGMLLNFLGFTCITSLVRTLVMYIPIVRDLVNISVTAFNVSLSTSLSLCTIALSWIIYRPAMALGILGLSLAFILLPRMRSQPTQYGRRFV